MSLTLFKNPPPCKSADIVVAWKEGSKVFYDRRRP
jgi:hypothetical protein